MRPIRVSLPDDLTDTGAFTARGSSSLYGKSKLLDIMFTLELARRIERTGVTANVLDPDDPAWRARLWTETERLLDAR